jgi:phosphoglycerol transferase MdoB-like AlkP superfamily enzyme
MNALEKLLDANGYARYVSMDHIMAQLLTPSPALGELDRGVQEMSIDLCRTLTEVGERVASAPAPIFAHSRSLNLHVAAIRASAVPPGETYSGFEPRYASRVHRMDSCFGDFIDFLKRQGIYDDSIVVLTADHGEELGADGRWGHAYYLFPGVLEVPLLVHVPRRLAAASAVDLDAAAFTTDLTPTLYAALGYRPERSSPLMGAPLIGSDSGDFSARRRGTEVVIASYGAVYGTLLQNGRRLYIADANHSVEYGYERGADGWRQVPVTDAVRAIGRRAIREYVEEIAREYDVHLG